jgi:hypothetical protein
LLPFSSWEGWGEGYSPALACPLTMIFSQKERESTIAIREKFLICD